MSWKNLPRWERLARLPLGAALAVWGGILLFAGQPFWGALLAASGAVIFVTAATGWCPACAMIGRKLPQGARTYLFKKVGAD